MADKGKQTIKMDRHGKPSYGGKKKGFQINGSSIKEIAQRAQYRMVYHEWLKAFTETHGEKRYNELTIQLGFAIWCHIIRSPGTPICVRDYLTTPLTMPQITERDGKRGSKAYKNALSNYFRAKIRMEMLQKINVVTLLNAPNTKQKTKDNWLERIQKIAKEAGVNFSHDRLSTIHKSLQKMAREPFRNGVVPHLITKLNDLGLKIAYKDGKYFVNDSRLMEVFVHLPRVVSQVYDKPDKYMGTLGKEMKEDLAALFYIIKVFEVGDKGIEVQASKKTIDKISSNDGRHLIFWAMKILGITK